MKKLICILVAYVIMALLIILPYCFGGESGVGFSIILVLLCIPGGFWFLWKNVGWSFSIVWGSDVILFVLWILLLVLKLMICAAIGVFVTPYKLGSFVAGIIPEK